MVERKLGHVSGYVSRERGATSDVVPRATSSPPTAPDAGRVDQATPSTVEETSVDAPSNNLAPRATSSPPTVPDAGRVAQAAPRNLLLWPCVTVQDNNNNLILY